MDFTGAWTALVTPFTPDGARVDFERLEESIAIQAAGEVAGVVPCGTTGESPTLTEAEHAQVVERSVDAARRHGRRVIAGAGSNCTRRAIEMHRAAEAAGADASLQVVPYYNRPSQRGLERHFLAIADACDLPVVLYNIPSRCGTALTVETIERLAHHPNIQAVKEATGSLDVASAIAARTPLALLSGDDSLTLPIGAVGGVGVISVLSNLVPRRVAELCGAMASGDWGRARSIHLDLLALARGLLTLDVNPVPIKTALALIGRDSGAVRLPLAEADEATTEAVREMVEGAVSRQLSAVS